MALTSSEVDLLEALWGEHRRTATDDDLLLRYYQGMQRVEQLGMAIPPQMRRFLVIANWPRVLVDTIRDRQQVRSVTLPGEETTDPRLSAIWEASNMSAHSAMFNTDRMVYGRAFMSVGQNENNPELPYIRVESPREMAALVDARTEQVEVAARFYEARRPGVTASVIPNDLRAVLYLPNETVWCSYETGEWAEQDRDIHGLGRPPIAMHLNRRMSGGWWGESEMTDVIPFADACARSLTNLQFAQEAHGIPRMWMSGVRREDFLDESGQPIPQFEAYFDAIHTIADSAGKIGQLTAADLKNFETAVALYGKQAATISGFPARFFGIETVNPPTEGSVRADEAGLVRSVEAQNEQVGVTLGWVAEMALRMATGSWLEGGNRIRVDWFDPATPTVAQRADAITKYKAAGILSREGAWDEMGWSEARKAKERAYFAEEATDPLMQALIGEASGADVSTSTDIDDTGVGTAGSSAVSGGFGADRGTGEPAGTPS